MMSPPVPTLRDTAWRALFDAVNASAGLAERGGLRLADFDRDRLLEEARSRTGLEDFGGEACLEPLGRLLEAYEAADHLTALGRIAARTDVLRILTNRLRMAEDVRRHPEIAEDEIRRPLVIVSLPRTGTTLLHGLLAQDPAHRAPRTWEVMYPSPPPAPGSEADANRIRRVRRQLRWFDRLAPEYRIAHPLGAELPQECMAITEHAFESPRFHRTHFLPRYRDWLAGRDLEHAYRLHGRILQLLQWRTPGERWVLKNPPHTFWIETLHRVYPDARFVQTHREPLVVLASFASHTIKLRRAFSRLSDSVDPDLLAARWAGGMEKLMAFRDREDVPDEAFVDVRYADLVRDPIGEVRRIYGHFGLSLEPQAFDRMERFLRKHPKDAHGVHRYSLEEYDFDPERHGSLFDRYRERFGIEPFEEDVRKMREASRR